MPITKTKKVVESPEHIKTYESHGIQFHERKGSDWKANCPFCGGKAFFVDTQEGKFHCKTCPAQGNKYVFLQLYFDHCFEKTTSKHRESLAEDRGLPVEAFEWAEYAYDVVTKKWLIPVRNEKGAMVNIGRWSKTVLVDGKRPVLMTAACKTHLGNLERLGDTKKVIITEGPWDCVALEWLLAQNKEKDIAVVWSPGCSNFNQDWAKHFEGREVLIVYDNDDPGYLGMERVTETLRNHSKPKSISTIQWPDSFPEKFDIRDYVGKKVKTPKKAWTELQAMLEEVKFKAPKKHELERTTFDQVIKDFEEVIHVTPELQDGLLLALSVIFSNKIFEDPYNPLWLFIIAPAGSGKTLLLQTLADSEYCRFETTMGPRTLVSGYKTPDGSDPSLLPLIIGKTLIIEDFTGIMSLPSGEQEEIYGVLRSAFNGRYEKTFGHVGTRVYPDPSSEHATCHFTILAGCTGAIHADKRANKGERFLKYHMSALDADPIAQVESAIKNTIDQTTPETILREPVSAFIDYRLSQETYVPTVPRWVEEKVIGLAQIIGIVRAVVLRNGGDLVVRPESEVATRLSKQLIKLGQAVAFTLDKHEIDEEVYRIMQRVGMDTCYGWHRDAIAAVASSDPELGITSKEVSRNARMSNTTAFRCLEDLLELGAVYFEVEDNYHRGRGKAPNIWYLSPLMTELFRRADIDLSIIAHEPPAGKNFRKRAKNLGTAKYKKGTSSPGKTKPKTSSSDSKVKEKPKSKVRKVARRTSK